MVERGASRLVNRNHAIEPGDLEDPAQIGVGQDEHELCAVRPEPAQAAHEDAEGRRVDERRLGEIDDDVP
jgi:hypothetical protein